MLLAGATALQQVTGERTGLGQSDQMTARQDVGLEPEPVAGHPALEVDREEPVTGAGHDPDRDGRPGVEVAGARERGRGFVALVLDRKSVV